MEVNDNKLRNSSSNSIKFLSDSSNKNDKNNLTRGFNKKDDLKNYNDILNQEEMIFNVKNFIKNIY